MDGNILYDVGIKDNIDGCGGVVCNVDWAGSIILLVGKSVGVDDGSVIVDDGWILSVSFSRVKLEECSLSLVLERFVMSEQMISRIPCHKRRFDID